MAGRSLVSRLIWMLASSMAGLWLLGSVAAGVLTVFEVHERLDDAIEEVAQRLLPATYDAIQQPQAMQQMAKRLVATMDPRALAYQIVGPAGEIIMRSENAPQTPFPVPRQAGFHDIPQYRVYSQPAAVDGYFIEVGEPAMHRSESLRRAVALTVGPLLLFLPLSWFFIRWAVFRSMRSLDRLRSEIGRRDGSNLSQIPDMGLPTELAPIEAAVNRLLERLARALATERQFAANSAHELRTPIAAVLAQMQLLSTKLTASPHAVRAARIVNQIKSLGSLAEKLLQLSRAGAGVGLLRERIDILTVLQVLVDEFRRREDVGDRLVVAAECPDEFIVQGELDVLGITLRNLIENAVRYGDPGEPIEIVIDRDRQIRLLNGGAVIPSETLETLKKPFIRGCAVGAGGGLGLAIVDNVMKQIGGSLTLISPVMGRVSGFEARLVFPEPT
ncbi:histidine kinase dimerization/phospho-acceptor domain-containing protein [Bradyrhizobium erythrophlei]|uniref:histidine kinase n=1 Tax=Bradyrhizobium erythrophlei TaxID=1437360 RepID=A0A1M5R0Y8_9BRAD|nr:histidine kinase dimerization/phospho-acceptor domain-containing protein [Bradyrhizobium erythrophlei]SHH19811.1 two-component system, OmpR family, sensor kinase [Bradyrhizobium erythrophlei]